MAGIDNEKRQVLLDTLEFLVNERNIALFHLAKVVRHKKAAANKETALRKKILQLRKRIDRDLLTYKHLLTRDEKLKIFGNDRGDLDDTD